MHSMLFLHLVFQLHRLIQKNIWKLFSVKLYLGQFEKWKEGNSSGFLLHCHTSKIKILSAIYVFTHIAAYTLLSILEYHTHFLVKAPSLN